MDLVERLKRENLNIINVVNLNNTNKEENDFQRNIFVKCKNLEQYKMFRDSLKKIYLDENFELSNKSDNYPSGSFTAKIKRELYSLAYSYSEIANCVKITETKLC